MPKSGSGSPTCVSRGSKSAPRDSRRPPGGPRKLPGGAQEDPRRLSGNDCDQKGQYKSSEWLKASWVSKLREYLAGVAEIWFGAVWVLEPCREAVCGGKYDEICENTLGARIHSGTAPGVRGTVRWLPPRGRADLRGRRRTRGSSSWRRSTAFPSWPSGSSRTAVPWVFFEKFHTRCDFEAIE